MHPWAHNDFNKIFQHHNIVLTPQNKYCIKNILNSNLKGNIPPEKKKIRHLSDQLQGKTKRDLETRVKEHFRNTKNREIENHPYQHIYGKKNMQWIVNQSY